MCLWILTACFGLVPTTQVSSPIIVLPGIPAPILQPTPAPSLPPPAGNVSFPPSDIPPSTSPTTLASTMPPTQPPTLPVTTPPAMTNPPSSPMTSASTNPPSQTGVLLPVVICQTPSAVCVANPNQPPTAGTVSPPIDPRLGTTPSPSAPLQVPPIAGYNGQLSSYDTAVKFPRNRRSISEIEMFDKNVENKHLIKKRQSCVCVPAGTCPPGGAGNFGIDFRIVTPNNPCGPGTVYCCVGGNPNPGTPLIACGARQTQAAIVVTPQLGQADFGEYPWMVIILTRQNDYVAGGVLINQFNVLTVIHRISPHLVGNTAPNIKARLGEWDASGTYEPVPYQEYSITKVFTHPSYNPNTLQFDLAVLRLASPVPITPQPGATTTINRACLPASPSSVYTGQRCWITGWGKNAFGTQGTYQQILKEVEVPIVAPDSCQASLRSARLGPSYVLDTTSFICAGGEAARDSCTGDGGSGLVCNVNGQWTVVGLVAWGLGCATAGVPAAYVNLAALLPWIQQQLATP